MVEEGAGGSWAAAAGGGSPEEDEVLERLARRMAWLPRMRAHDKTERRAWVAADCDSPRRGPVQAQMR